MATKDRTSLKNDFANGKYATGEKFADLIDSMKVVQLPVVDPQALGTSLSFIDSISQDADGKITATKKTLDLANAHELNPFKGWYKTGDTLPTDGFDGAYLYFKDTTEQTGLTTIYRWNGTTYADTGTVVDTSNVQTFGSGQAVNDVKIKDENGEEVGGDADVLSAAAGKSLWEQICEKESEVLTADPITKNLTSDASGNFISKDNAAFKIYAYNIEKSGTLHLTGESTGNSLLFVVGTVSSIQDIVAENTMNSVLFEGIYGDGTTPVEFDETFNVTEGQIIVVSGHSLRAMPTATLFVEKNVLNELKEGVEGLKESVEDLNNEVENLNNDVEELEDGVINYISISSANIHNSAAAASQSSSEPTDGRDWAGHSISTAGAISENSTYNLTSFIEIDYSVAYKCSRKVRRIVAFKDDKTTVVSSLESINAGSSIDFSSVQNANTIKYIRFIYDNAGETVTPSDVKFGKYTDDINVPYGETTIDHDKFGRKILLEGDVVLPDIGRERLITIENSDKILIVGSSSVASSYSLALKSFTNKLNDSLDWLILTYGISGNTCAQLTAALKSDEAVGYAAGVKPSQVHPTFVYVGHYKNMRDVAQENTSDNIIEQNRILMEACKSVFNAPLIVGSDYNNETSMHGEMAMLQLAKELGADYYPIGNYNSYLIRSSAIPSGLWSGAHPGTKTNNFYYQEIYNIFKELNQPKQSIKVYIPRDGVSDYTYRNSIERNEKFVSIENGNVGLNVAAESYYDMLDELPSGNIGAISGDYYKLMKKDSVSLDTKALVEVIVPVVNAEKFEVYVESENIADITIKVYNNNTGVYDTLTKTDIEDADGAFITIEDVKYTQFDKIKILLDSSSTISINDVYVKCYGGKEKAYKREINANSMSGTPVYQGGQGFGADWESVWDNDGECESYIQTTKYGNDFADLPKFLNLSTNKVVVLPYHATDKKEISLTIPSTTLNDGVETMLPRLLRVEVYCRTFSKIYNPTAYSSWVGDNNPYTNTPNITSKSYDYTTLGLDIGIAQNNDKVAVLEEKVGQFWSRVLFDVWVPPFTNSDMTFSLYRKPADLNSDFELQIADVAITRITDML